MFERIFPKRSGTPPLPQPNAQLALGALLVRVAFADRDYRPEELAQIDRILAATFDLGPIEAAKLRATCEALERDAPGTPEFAAILKAEVEYSERLALAGHMWRIVLADGDLDAAEEATLHQIEAALGLTPEDSAQVQAGAQG